MNIIKDLEKLRSIFLDTAPIIYYIEAHDKLGPLVKHVVELMNAESIQVFTTVLTLTEVLSKPITTGNDELADKFSRYLKGGKHLTMLAITESIAERAGSLRGKHPYLKTIDSVQIAAALEVHAEAFLTNERKRPFYVLRVTF